MSLKPRLLQVCIWCSFEDWAFQCLHGSRKKMNFDTLKKTVNKIKIIHKVHFTLSKLCNNSSDFAIQSFCLAVVMVGHSSTIVALCSNISYSIRSVPKRKPVIAPDWLGAVSASKLLVSQGSPQLRPEFAKVCSVSMRLSTRLCAVLGTPLVETSYRAILILSWSEAS